MLDDIFEMTDEISRNITAFRVFLVILSMARGHGDLAREIWNL